MVKRILGFVVNDDEEVKLYEYCKELSAQKNGSLLKPGLERLITFNSKLGLNTSANVGEASQTIMKIQKTCKLKGINFVQEMASF